MFLIRIIFLPLRLPFYIFFKLCSLGRKKEILSHSIPDRFSMLPPSGWLAFLFPSTERSFIDYLAFLRLVEKSEEIKKVVYTVPEVEASWDQLEQVGAALTAIARSGKKLIAHTNGGNLKSLYLMALAKQRYAAPHANFIILLPSFESYFIKETLDRLGVSVEIQSAGRYKGSGFESFTRRNFSPQSRQSMSSLLQAMRQELQQNFEKTPGLSTEAQRKTLSLLKNKVLIQAKDLLTSGFLQKTIPSSHFLEKIILKKTAPLPSPTAHVFSSVNQNKKSAEDSKNTKEKKQIREKAWQNFKKSLQAMSKVLDDDTFSRRYKRSKFPLFRLSRTPSLALVVMEGSISMGRPEDPPRNHGISALPFCELFKDLLQNRDEAVFLYINSPGGSADASEILYEGIYQLSRIKPVFAFLGPIAASGGYYIACAANRIYASPLSITGSIGVIRIRPDLQKLYTSLGIRKESLIKDPTREIFSEAAKLAPETQHLLHQTLQSTYDLFLQRVSQGRNKANKEVLKMAEGRVFTGRQFQKEGMIDGHFSFMEALRSYKEACNIPAKREYQFQYYPEFKMDPRALLSSYSRAGIIARIKEYGLPSDFINFKQGMEQVCKNNTGRPLLYFAWERALRNL